MSDLSCAMITSVLYSTTASWRDAGSVPSGMLPAVTILGIVSAAPCLRTPCYATTVALGASDVDAARFGFLLYVLATNSWEAAAALATKTIVLLAPAQDRLLVRTSAEFEDTLLQGLPATHVVLCGLDVLERAVRDSMNRSYPIAEREQSK